MSGIPYSVVFNVNTLEIIPICSLPFFCTFKAFFLLTFLVPYNFFLQKSFSWVLLWLYHHFNCLLTLSVWCTIRYIFGIDKYFRSDQYVNTVYTSCIFVSSSLACQYIFYQNLAEWKSFTFKSVHTVSSIFSLRSRKTK